MYKCVSLLGNHGNLCGNDCFNWKHAGKSIVHEDVKRNIMGHHL
jgi:hypothetical protein